MLFTGLALVAALQTSEPRVVVRRMPAAGLGAVEGVCRRDPSDVIRIGELDYVFYTRVELGDPLYPRRLAGRIWYATSDDEGHSWIERGLALDRGPEGAFDSLGVFDPAVRRDQDGRLLLYFAAIGPPFNFRFEASARSNTTHLGVAELTLDEDSLVSGTKWRSTEPLLSPQPRKTRAFDSLQVTDPTVLVRDDLYYLYYQARAFPEEDDRTTTGLVISESPNGPFSRAPFPAPALDFSKDTSVWNFREGVLSLVTQAERGLYWALDGEHFARVVERVEGGLNEPGLARPKDQHAPRELWGIHVGGYADDPFLERFELELIGEVPPPPPTILPVASAEDRASAAGWLNGGDWQAQHLEILELAKTRPADVVFLGDSITQSWGGRGRQVGAPGAAALQKHFGAYDVGNYGISGDRTQHILWRIDQGEFQRGRSKVVVLLIGTNNIGQDPPADIAAGVREILARLRRALPQGEILLLGILPRGASTTAPDAEAVRETNALLAGFGRLPRVNYLDLASELTDASGELRPELFRQDRLHLSEAGYEAVAAALHLPVAKLMLPPQLR
jgi:lysophospholipase L1-like esterase